MPIQTEQTYYENPALHGSYQYVTLKDVIDEMLLETTDTDSHLSQTRRSYIVTKAKKGIQELNREVKKTILAVERTVGPELSFELPQDYIDWVRVSLVGEDFKLKTLKVNSDMPTTVGYLQDSNYKLLFDNNGESLRADSSNIYNKDYEKYTFHEDVLGSKYGEFVVDERRGVIGFSSDLEDKEVVIEYISDGLQMFNLKDDEITIHKNIKSALEAFIYMECIMYRRSVPRNEKNAAIASYRTKLHKCKLDNLHFNVAELNGKIEYSGSQNNQ